MKNYFNFRVRGLQLFAVCIGYLLCIVAGGYSGMTISMHYTQAAAMAAVDPVTSSAVAREALVELVVFQILYLLAACLLAFFYMRICIEGIEYRGEAVRTAADVCNVGDLLSLVYRTDDALFLGQRDIPRQAVPF